MSLSEEQMLDLCLLKEDLAYHQLRVLLLISAVSSYRGNSRKLDGLTKLAKLDFLVRYPALAHIVLDHLDPGSPGLHLGREDNAHPTEVESPMVRYKYGPWDDRYYPVIGALVGRGLIRYSRGRLGSVALVPTPQGRTLCGTLAASKEWSELSDRVNSVAEASIGLTGNALKDLIYQRLAPLMDRPQRQVIR